MARILVIDDEPQMRDLLHQILQRAGHSVVEAPDGAVGINLFRQAPTDLVITDLLMPEKEGLETIMELRREFPRLPVIAMSGGGREGFLNFLPAAEKLGAVASLAKPFDRQQLLDLVNQVLAAATE